MHSDQRPTNQTKYPTNPLDSQVKNKTKPMEFPLLNIGILIFFGIVAGIIGTLAGGGSNLTMLMVMRLPPEVANATNRVAVFLRSLVGLKGFHANDRLDTHDARPILLPIVLGSFVGALCAELDRKTPFTRCNAHHVVNHLDQTRGNFTSGRYNPQSCSRNSGILVGPGVCRILRRSC